MKKTLTKLILAGSLVLTVLGVSGCGNNAINLNDYVEVEITGFNGYGNAEVIIDEENLESEIANQLELDLSDTDPDSFEELGELLLAEEKVDRVLNCIDFVVEPSGNLENGDSVVVNAVVDEEETEELGVVFEFKEISMKVEDLEEAIVISEEKLFEDIIVEFIGMAPYAEVRIRNTSEDDVISEISFFAEQVDEDGVDKGDKITITARNYKEFEARGYVFEDVSKEYVAEYVDAYVSEFSEIDEASLSKIMKQAQDMIHATLMTNNLDTGFYKGDEYKASMYSFDSITEPQLETSYFYTGKDGVWTSVNNRLVIVYSFDLTGMGGGFFEADKADYENCYITICLDDIELLKDGTISFDLGNMIFSDGYASFDTFYRIFVTENIDNYEIEEIQLDSYL